VSEEAVAGGGGGGTRGADSASGGGEDAGAVTLRRHRGHPLRRLPTNEPARLASRLRKHTATSTTSNNQLVLVSVGDEENTYV